MFYTKDCENGRYVSARKPTHVKASSKSDKSTCFPITFYLVHSTHPKPNDATIQVHIFHPDSRREEKEAQSRSKTIPLPFVNINPYNISYQDTLPRPYTRHHTASHISPPFPPPPPPSQPTLLTSLTTTHNTSTLLIPQSAQTSTPPKPSSEPFPHSHQQLISHSLNPTPLTESL